MANRAAKGSDFEREFCVRLSKWWSNGQRDDIFWRPGGSGGRATNRFKKGKTTDGQYGDVVATHPSGKLLMEIVTMELKRGYNKVTIMDVLDRPSNLKQQQWEAFLEQAIRSHQQAGSYSWMLVTRRDRRVGWVWMGTALVVKLVESGVRFGNPSASFNTTIRLKEKPGDKFVHRMPVDMFGVPVDNFFNAVTPAHFKSVYKTI